MSLRNAGKIAARSRARKSASIGLAEIAPAKSPSPALPRAPRPAWSARSARPRSKDSRRSSSSTGLGQDSTQLSAAAFQVVWPPDPDRRLAETQLASASITATAVASATLGSCHPLQPVRGRLDRQSEGQAARVRPPLRGSPRPALAVWRVRRTTSGSATAPSRSSSSGNVVRGIDDLALDHRPHERPARPSPERFRGASLRFLGDFRYDPLKSRGRQRAAAAASGETCVARGSLGRPGSRYTP